MGIQDSSRKTWMHFLNTNCVFSKCSSDWVEENRGRKKSLPKLITFNTNPRNITILSNVFDILSYTRVL